MLRKCYASFLSKTSFGVVHFLILLNNMFDCQKLFFFEKITIFLNSLFITFRNWNFYIISIVPTNPESFSMFYLKSKFKKIREKSKKKKATQIKLEAPHLANCQLLFRQFFLLKKSKNNWQHPEVDYRFIALLLLV